MLDDVQQACVNIQVGDVITMSPATRQIFIHQQELPLTGLEFNLLSLLLAQSPNIVCYEVIAAKIFHQAYSCCKASICTHICHLRSKLKARDNTLAIKAVRGAGYYLLEQH